MLVKNFFDAFQAGKSLTNATTWKNAQLLGSKLAILLGALLPIANAFGYFSELTVQDTVTVAGAIVVVVGMFNGAATVVSTDKIGLRGAPRSQPDSARKTSVAEPVSVRNPEPVESPPVESQPLDSKPVEPDLFHNRSLG
jgi:hypothetical protein